MQNDSGQALIHVAACRGCLDIVRLLLQNGTHVDISDTRGFTPTCIASYQGNMELLRLLIENGADIDKPNNDAITPLCVALYYGTQPEMAPFLLDHGASINKVLYAACVYGMTEMARWSIQNSADVNEVNAEDGDTPLEATCLGNHLEMVKLLTGDGTSANKALHTACIYGRVEVARWLLQNNADINEVDDEDDETPLDSVCICNHLEIVKLLIGHGANVNKALHAACGHGNIHVARWLVKNNADVNEANGTAGATPLHAACFEGTLEVVQILIDHGADVSKANGDGETPLHAACSGDHLEVPQLLVEQGAGVSKALFAACKYGKIEVAGWSLKKNADANEANHEDGDTPLHVACNKGNAAVVILLLQHGADAKMASKSGSTPLDCAYTGDSRSQGNSDHIAEELIRRITQHRWV